MAMIKNKHIAFSLFLVCLVVVSPMAKAQLGTGLLSVINANAVIGCVLSGLSGPAFSNALVQLQCQNQTVASTTTSIAGVISITVPLRISLPDLLSGCQLVVVRPLSNCTPSLSAGSLVSGPLAVLGSIVSRTLNTTIVIPTRITLLTP